MCTTSKPISQLKQAGQTHKITTENKRLQFVLDFFWHQDWEVTFFFLFRWVNVS